MSTYVDILDLARTNRRNLFNEKRLNKAIADARLDAVVAVSKVNITYTGGSVSQGGNLLAFVVTTAGGKQGLIINEADAYYYGEYSWITTIRSYRYLSNGYSMNQNSIRLLTEMLKEFGLANARIGIEIGQIPTSHFADIKASLPGVTWEEGGPVFEYARLVKTPGEIELFRLAARSSDKAIQAAWSTARPGISEKLVAARMQSFALQMGADTLGHCHMQSGLHSTVAHSWPMEKPLLPGEVVHVDFGAGFGGYYTDFSRNAIVGKATQKQDRIYRHMWEIEQLLIEDLRPGAIAGDLWDRTEKAFAKAGLVYPWGTIGHSTGLDVHEGFEISKGSETLFEAGMIINIEPSHIEQGDARYHLEDSYLITEKGCELLTDVMDTRGLFPIG